MNFSIYNTAGINTSVDGVFWSHIILIIGILHSAIWCMIEFDTLPRTIRFKWAKLLCIAFMYWVSASLIGLLILSALFQIGAYSNSEPTDIKQIILIIASVVLFIIIVVKLTRCFLEIVRGNNTLIDNFRVYKRLIGELIKQNKENEMSNCSNKHIVPQNERGVNMFGNFIAQKRKELGLSLAKLAKLSGHPVSSLHGIENGDNQNPRFEIIIDISQVLGVSLDEMKAAFLEDRNKHD